MSRENGASPNQDPSARSGNVKRVLRAIIAAVGITAFAGCNVSSQHPTLEKREASHQTDRTESALEQQARAQTNALAKTIAEIGPREAHARKGMIHTTILAETDPNRSWRYIIPVTDGSYNLTIVGLANPDGQPDLKNTKLVQIDVDGKEDDQPALYSFEFGRDDGGAIALTVIYGQDTPFQFSNRPLEGFDPLDADILSSMLYDAKIALRQAATGQSAQAPPMPLSAA